MSKGWIRPLNQDAWSLIPRWRHIHEFMSAQAATVGGLILTVFIAVGFSNTVLLVTLAVTVTMVLVGTLTEQPELKSYEPDDTDAAGA
jgi:hypothetical protein